MVRQGKVSKEKCEDKKEKEKLNMIGLYRMGKTNAHNLTMRSWARSVG